jgi:predicted RND superfamily exporter protein
MNPLTDSAIARPGWWMTGTAVFCLALVAAVLAPTLAPGTFPWLSPLKVDTDPENMLSASEPVRVFHNAMKREFSLHDMVVVGVVDESSPVGVFTPETLAEVYDLAEYAAGVRWEGDAGVARGVIAADIIAPSTVDNIEQAGVGSVRFDWLLPRPPESEEEALAVRDRAKAIPTLDDTLVSGDGRALALYIPLTSKDVSFRVAQQLRERIATYDSGASWYITGLPIAQDQFGVEMFKQMAMSAPAAMLLIFVLMFVFFRNLNLIVSPMVVAMAAVIGAMGALIATGNTVHIMSSMIPIFVMPIAVLDAVHMLSDFYDRYPLVKDRRKALSHVMHELWTPMLFTTLTTCIGFGSLAFAPIPPVQVFGIFVALGVFLAWLFTITLVPAYIMLMPENAFDSFGMVHADSERGLFARLLPPMGRLAARGRYAVLVLLMVALGVAGFGLTRIEINDNPVKWFAPDHEIRVADRVLNERFAGTYMAYLTLRPRDALTPAVVADALEADLESLGTTAAAAALERLSSATAASPEPVVLIDGLVAWAEGRREAAVADEDWTAWDDVVLALEKGRQLGDTFKDPELLRWMGALQAHLDSTGEVGKTNALPDIVKTVHRELFLGDASAFRIPDTREAVAQTLITFQNSHRPQDLFKMVTPDYRRANVWVQLSSGDNVDMNRVVAATDQYLQANPPPVALAHEWFGLTYINTVWQDRMVKGMGTAFAGSFVIVLILMTILFRSLAWGLMSMVPLTVTIAVIYGAIGLLGKDYDMPIAVLSSLSLGLAIDYAIHFNARSRHIFAKFGDWPRTLTAVFGEPARAILRNVIVIGVGFLPLLLAPLVPYQTVGVFISAILLLAGAVTLVGLPALITIFQHSLFARRSHA